MSDDLVVEHLRIIPDTVQRIDGAAQILKSRVTAIETLMVTFAHQLAIFHLRLDRFDDRLARIETRLDLHGATV